MRNTSRLPPVLLLVGIAAVGSMRLWWLHASRMEQRYLVDYCRFSVNMPSFPLWPYRIQTVQHLPLTVIPDIFGGRPIYLVLIWPLIATVGAAIAGFVIAAMLSRPSGSDRLLAGAPVVSHWRWNWPLLFRKSKRGFFIETR